MATQWHIDNASALIVDGTRFTLQTYNYRNNYGGTYFTHTAWLKAPQQTGPGLVITAPLYLPDASYEDWDPVAKDWVYVQGLVLKERTFEYYGQTGWKRGETPQYITGLGVYKPSEVAGERVLTFKNLRLTDWNPSPLYFDNKYAFIGGPGFASRGVGLIYKVDLLGTDISWS